MDNVLNFDDGQQRVYSYDCPHCERGWYAPLIRSSEYYVWCDDCNKPVIELEVDRHKEIKSAFYVDKKPQSEERGDE